MIKLLGKQNHYYVLENHPFGHGGEGAVYRIVGEPSLCAKLYFPEKKFPTEAARKELQNKLEAMYAMKMKTTIDGILRVAWVKDVLFDNVGFVGYVMPRVSYPYKIFQLSRSDRFQLFQRFTWKYSLQLAYNLSWVVWYMHMNDIVIGDMNMNNIMIGPRGEVALIDCDSFDITDRTTGIHYRCTVGLPELLAPELQNVGSMEIASVTKESDNFSLAIHLFRLLMNNADPFGTKVLGIYVQSKSNIETNAAILNGECPHFRRVRHKTIPDFAPRIEFLPPDLIEAFDRTFHYTQLTAKQRIAKRTTAEEWNRLLLKYAQAEPNPNLKTCDRNSSHVYSAHLTLCPFCPKPYGSGLVP